MAQLIFQYEITNAGGTITLDAQTWQGADAVLYLYTTGAVTLAANVVVAVSSDFTIGSSLTIIQSANNITRNGKRLNITLPSGGYAYTDDYEFLVNSKYVATRVDTATYDQIVTWNLDTGNGVAGYSALSDASTPFGKMEDMARGSILVGDSTDRPSFYDAKTNLAFLIGDGTDLKSYIVDTVTSKVQTAITAGKIVFSFLAGAIVNADINAAAAISLSKLAALTASKPVSTSAGGVLTTSDYVIPAYGGLGADASSSTGFVTFNAGTSAIGAISEVINFHVSFESGKQCNNRFKIPFGCTVTNVYAVCTKAIANTDAGTIVMKNAAGTTMTGGTITFAASDPLETAYTITPSANNTGSANDIFYAVTSKATAGGEVLLSITVTRTS